MPHALSAAIARVRPPTESDGELLGRFVRARDDESFALLVRQLGPMVLGVCRRVAGDAHLADDAFQAAFLVLARRAPDVRPRESVRGWMYGVAVRTAREARTVSARRRARECPVPVLPDREAEMVVPPDADALRILDEEVAALPDHLRTAVVLCELEGAPRKAAAERLGVAEGTLSRRLAKARKLLAERLKQRGIVMPAAGLGALLTALPVSARLASATSALLTAAAVPPAVAALTNGAFRTMYLHKLAAVGLAVVFVAAYLAAAPQDPPPKPRAAAVRVPAAPREGVIAVTSFQTGPPIVLLTPDGKELSQPPVGAAAAPVNRVGPAVCPLWNGRLSPDATRLVAIKLDPIPRGNKSSATPNHLWVFDVSGKGRPPELIAADIRDPSAAWSPDGTKLYVSEADPEKLDAAIAKDKTPPRLWWVHDFATNRKTQLAVPPGHILADVSPDGKTLLTYEFDAVPRPRNALIPLDTLKPRPFGDGEFVGGRFSPDGKWILGGKTGLGRPGPHAMRSVADGTEKVIPLVAGAEYAIGVCWSPDGKRVAYHWTEEVPPPAGAPQPAENAPKFFAHRVTVSDLDGKNAKTILRRDHDQPIMGLDWR